MFTHLLTRSLIVLQMRSRKRVTNCRWDKMLILSRMNLTINVYWQDDPYVSIHLCLPQQVQQSAWYTQVLSNVHQINNDNKSLLPFICVHFIKTEFMIIYVCFIYLYNCLFFYLFPTKLPLSCKLGLLLGLAI